LYSIKIHFVGEKIEIQCVFTLRSIFKAFYSKNFPSLHLSKCRLGDR
jgi:hypothetical protein